MKEIFKPLLDTPFFEKTVFLIPNWQWATITIIIFTGYLASTIIALFLSKALTKLIKKSSILKSAEHLPVSSLIRPINLALIGWFWFLGIYLIGASELAIDILSAAAKVLTYTGLVWTGWRLTDFAQHYLSEKAKTTKTKVDDLMAPLITRTIKVLLIIVGFLSGAEILSLPISSLLAGLGIGGIAIAMAAKDTIANIFGSLTVIADRSFHMGDWIKVGDQEGMVEKLGFRSTKIRTFYNSLLTIPNGKLLTATIDNLGERKYRRIKTTLSLTYDTAPEKIDAFCDGIKDLIKAQKSTRKDYYIVNFQDFGPSSLDILLYCFLKVPDYEAEMKERHHLFTGIIKLAKTLKVEFAYPTQTLHLKK